MKILFIANRFPYPPFRGDKLKIYNLCKRLSVQHELHLICFSEQASDLQYEPELTPIFTSITVISLPKFQSYWQVLLGLIGKLPLQVNYFKSKRFQKALDTLLAHHTFDAIHVQHLRMAQYAKEIQSTYKILDLPDAFSLYWQRRMQVPRNIFSRLLDRIESKRVIAYEKAILKQFDLNLVCSNEDLNFLKIQHQVDKIALLPNGVDTDLFKPKNHDYAHNKILLFTGNMDYAPNVDAVQYFVKDIWPLIQIQCPDITFVIAGQRPIEAVKQLASDTIKVTGFIPDLSEMYNQASVVVAPLRFGAGTQNKVLEAMAMGIPVVCSNIGFEGLGIQDGEGAFMRTNALQFADQVIALLQDHELRKATGLRGTEVIHAQFSWDKIANQLANYFKH
jgi:sugar transferase (PEP-CTERM/EpsH1 system associated)